LIQSFAADLKLEPIDISWPIEPEHRLVRLVTLSPGPVHADIGVVFRLSGDGMAVAEQELLSGMIFEVVVTANVNESG
jgi:hypothetical protein